MAVELGSGYISINPSTRNFGSDLSRQIGPEVDKASRDAGNRAGEGFTSSFGSGLGKLGAVAAGAFAGLAVGDLLKGSIDAASNLGETLSKVSVVLGQDALPGLEAWAEGAATAFGQSKQQALDAAATFAVFGKSAGLTGSDLSGFSTQLSGLASDMASFSNTTTDEAITAIGAALRGESEPIRQYGVLLDEATLKNRAMALGIISTTKNALTPQQRVLAAQAEILAQTGDAQGDFARTSGGLANQLRILKAQLANGRAELGKAFLPAVTSVVTFLTKTGIPGFQRFTGVLKTTLAPAFQAAARAFHDFAAEVDGVGAPTAGFFAKLGDTVGRGLLAVRKFIDDFKAGLSGVGTPINDVATRLGGFVGRIVDTLQLVPAAFSAAFSGQGVTSDGFIGAVETIATKVASLVTFLQTDVPAAIAAFTDGFKNGSDDLDKNAKFETLARIGETFKSIVDTIRDNKDIFGPIAAGVGALAAALLVMSKVSPVLSLLGGVVSNLGAVFALLTNPVTLVLAAVVGLGVAAFLAYKKIKPFHDAVDAVAKVFQEKGFAAGVDEAGTQFGRLWDIVRPKLIEFRDKAAAWLADHGAEIFAGLGKAGAGIVAFLTTDLLGPLGQWIAQTAAPWLRDKVTTEWAPAFFGWVTGTAVPMIGEKLPLIVDAIIRWLRDNEPKILDAFNRFADFAVRWIEDKAIPFLQAHLPGILTALLDWANANLPEWGRQLALLGLDAIGRMVAAIVEHLPDLFLTIPAQLALLGVALVGAMFKSVFDALPENFQNFTRSIIDFVTGLPDLIVTAATGMWHGIVDAFEAIWSSISPDRILGFFVGLPARIADAAVGMWDGLYDAFRGALNFIIRGWNSLQFKLPSFDGLKVFGQTVIPGFVGPSLGVPPIDELAGGGVFTNDFTGLLRLAETPAARPEIVTPQRLMAETFRKELAAVGAGRGGVQVGAINVTEAQSASAVIDEVNARLGWKLTTRNER